MSDELSIQFTRFSAFYTPLIATLAGGFLQEEGFQPKHSIAPPGKSAIEGLVNGTVDVAQSAPAQGFGPLEKGQPPPAAHFAQINEKDGFFLTARAPDPAFTWDKPRGKEARLLDAARRDHTPGLRGDPRRLPAFGPDHPAAPVRGRDRGAARFGLIGASKPSGS